MIQFNLLPDVKLEFVKAQRVKRAVISGAVIATGASFLIFMLLFVAVHVIQKKIISDQTAKINLSVSQLKNTPDLDKVLTVQSQLNSLTSLHAAKPVAGRTFSFIQQLVPKEVSLTDVTIDYVEQTVSISGKAPKLDNINVLVDTLKLTTFAKTGEQPKDKAFSNVVLSSFTKSDIDSTFTLTAKYNPTIYDNSDTVQLSIPTTVSTQSVSSQPTFTKPTSNESAN